MPRKFSVIYVYQQCLRKYVIQLQHNILYNTYMYVITASTTQIFQ